ncbi:MAG: hypothetical protein V1721_09080 [Pseudomonadota bacterium]
MRFLNTAAILAAALALVSSSTPLMAKAPDALKQETLQKLAKVRVVVQYRYVTDGKALNRSLDDVIKIFREAKADFIFQGWLTQHPLPEKCSDLPKNIIKKCEMAGYSAENLRNAVATIKKELPDVIFSGGTQFEFFYPGEIGGRDEKEQRDKAWGMTFNPAKWGLGRSRRDAQCYWAKRWGMAEKGPSCPGEEDLKSSMRYYFPDVTDPGFQEAFLNRIYRQIDAGVDAIWIDMLYVQPSLLEELTKDKKHPAVRESYDAIWKIVDKIHEYGYTKGKYIYVITWVADRKHGVVEVIPKTNVDIAMISPQSNEIKDRVTGKIGQFDEKLWDDVTKQIREKLGLPIFARIDYGGGGRSPLGVFSQELTGDEAREFLITADNFFSKQEIQFIYPLHGGDMGLKEKVKILSYDTYNWYDSWAPEFNTFETMKELAIHKSQK